MLDVVSAVKLLLAIKVERQVNSYTVVWLSLEKVKDKVLCSYVKKVI